MFYNMMHKYVIIFYDEVLTADAIGGCIGGGVGMKGDIAGAIAERFISISFICKKHVNEIFLKYEFENTMDVSYSSKVVV